jgi:hypothetical protein
MMRALPPPAPYANQKTYRYVGKEQSFKVPERVTKLYIIAIGGGGGGSTVSYGSRVTAIVPVSSGEILRIRVGGNGAQTAGGFNGGGKGGFYGYSADKHNGYGGGGATDIRQFGDSLSDRVLVAGGGGGQGGLNDYPGPPHYGVGGKGGNLTAGNGAQGFPAYGTVKCAKSTPCGGQGGTQSAGGAGGPGGAGTFCTGAPGNAGAIAVGGTGATFTKSSEADSCGGLGGGGGGGYYGGGGGGGAGSDRRVNGIQGGGGGGGGSSYAEPKATEVHMWHGWTHNQYGLVVVHWN